MVAYLRVQNVLCRLAHLMAPRNGVSGDGAHVQDPYRSLYELPVADSNVCLTLAMQPKPAVLHP